MNWSKNMTFDGLIWMPLNATKYFSALKLLNIWVNWRKTEINMKIRFRLLFVFLLSVMKSYIFIWNEKVVLNSYWISLFNSDLMLIFEKCFTSLLFSLYNCISRVLVFVLIVYWKRADYAVPQTQSNIWKKEEENQYRQQLWEMEMEKEMDKS